MYACMYLFFPNYSGTTSLTIQYIVAWYYRQPSYYYYYYCCLPLTIHSTPPLWKTEAKNNMCDDDDMSSSLALVLQCCIKDEAKMFINIKVEAYLADHLTDKMAQK